MTSDLFNNIKNITPTTTSPKQAQTEKQNLTKVNKSDLSSLTRIQSLTQIGASDQLFDECSLILTGISLTIGDPERLQTYAFLNQYGPISEFLILSTPSSPTATVRVVFSQPVSARLAIIGLDMFSFRGEQIRVRYQRLKALEKQLRTKTDPADLEGLIPYHILTKRANQTGTQFYQKQRTEIIKDIYERQLDILPFSKQGSKNTAFPSVKWIIEYVNTSQGTRNIFEDVVLGDPQGCQYPTATEVYNSWKLEQEKKNNERMLYSNLAIQTPINLGQFFYSGQTRHSQATIIGKKCRCPHCIMFRFQGKQLQTSEQKGGPGGQPFLE